MGDVELGAGVLPAVEIADPAAVRIVLIDESLALAVGTLASVHLLHNVNFKFD